MTVQTIKLYPMINHVTDWPVPLTKLKKVHTVSVKPEDIQESISNIVTCAPKEGGQESTTSREKRIARNKKRKLKKKRQKEKEKESKMRSTDTSTSSGREFTY
ncbi:hypothetical protein AC249_AIPGENE22018 [Exaiptasia diaphana]|nr:hypothetical protein AC249_AIPGENE22018 [Exaiptasia diaphana]